MCMSHLYRWSSRENDEVLRPAEGGEEGRDVLVLIHSVGIVGSNPT